VRERENYSLYLRATIKNENEVVMVVVVII